MLPLIDNPAQSPEHNPVRYSQPYHNLVELQRLVMDKARDPECKGSVLSGLSRAFKELEELKLRIRMKPAPKAIDVTLGQPKRRGSQPRTSEGSEF